eukprot:31123_1
MADYKPITNPLQTYAEIFLSPRPKKFDCLSDLFTMGSCSSVLYGPCQKKSYTNDYYSVGLCSMRGCRNTMQDSHCVYLSIPNHPKYSLFAVFDGFNGNEASKYLSTNLINILSKL